MRDPTFFRRGEYFYQDKSGKGRNIYRLKPRGKSMTQESHKTTDFQKERRKFVRAGIYAVTRYFCPLRDREVGVQTRISDISEGGALLVTFMEGVPIDAPVEMSFILPGGNLLVSVKGVIRHTGSLEKDLFCSGVEFFKIKKNELLAIREYVVSHRKK